MSHTKLQHCEAFCNQESELWLPSSSFLGGLFTCLNVIELIWQELSCGNSRGSCVRTIIALVNRLTMSEPFRHCSYILGQYITPLVGRTELEGCPISSFPRSLFYDLNWVTHYNLTITPMTTQCDSHSPPYV